MNCTRCGSTRVYRNRLCAYCFGYQRGAASPASDSADVDYALLGIVVFLALLIIFAAVIYAVTH